MKPERECPECCGSGYQYAAVGPYDAPLSELVDCPYCKGTGEIDPEEESTCNGSE